MRPKCDPAWPTSSLQSKWYRLLLRADQNIFLAKLLSWCLSHLVYSVAGLMYSKWPFVNIQVQVWANRKIPPGAELIHSISGDDWPDLRFISHVSTPVFTGSHEIWPSDARATITGSIIQSSAIAECRGKNLSSKGSVILWNSFPDPIIWRTQFSGVRFIDDIVEKCGSMKATIGRKNFPRISSPITSALLLILLKIFRWSATNIDHYGKQREIVTHWKFENCFLFWDRRNYNG